MSLVVITGGARSGKSTAAQRLVASKHEDAFVVVCAHAPDDPEMARRTAAHRAARPAAFQTLEAREGLEWMVDVPEDRCLLLDCLGTLVGQVVGAAFASSAETSRADDLVSEATESSAEEAVDTLVDWLLARDADTVVVTNEVGSGIVPVYPDARLFRDVLGRANRRLVDGADAAYLAVAGRLLDLKALSPGAAWPGEE
jgi:adenosylcobinamide kinase/adenosylcobinamide-phosphate guanylyltransferase